jgi:hypothetical protein
MTDQVGMATGNQAALKTMYFRIQNQVFMMSFLQLIYVIMIVFAVSFSGYLLGRTSWRWIPSHTFSLGWFRRLFLTLTKWSHRR